MLIQNEKCSEWQFYNLFTTISNFHWNFMNCSGNKLFFTSYAFEVTVQKQVLIKAVQTNIRTDFTHIYLYSRLISFVFIWQSSVCTYFFRSLTTATFHIYIHTYVFLYSLTNHRILDIQFIYDSITAGCPRKQGLKKDHMVWGAQKSIIILLFWNYY